MSEPVDSNPEVLVALETTTADKRTIAQVEKWLDMIREMSAEEQPSPALQADAVTEQLVTE
jgi:hypothetical protein